MPAATPTLEASDLNLVWIDLEMTGLDPERDRIIEVAVVVTDPHLVARVTGPVFAIPPERCGSRRRWTAWNKGTHGRSGLIDRVKAIDRGRGAGRDARHRVPAASRAEEQVADVRQQHLPGSALPRPDDAAPRSVLPLPQPRRQHAEGTGAALEARHHGGFHKAQAHTALADIEESIDELAYYRQHFLSL
jgi:oligoribonuclease